MGGARLRPSSSDPSRDVSPTGIDVGRDHLGVEDVAPVRYLLSGDQFPVFDRHNDEPVKSRNDL